MFEITVPGSTGGADAAGAVGGGAGAVGLVLGGVGLPEFVCEPCVGSELPLELVDEPEVEPVLPVPVELVLLVPPFAEVESVPLVPGIVGGAVLIAEPAPPHPVNSKGKSTNAAAHNQMPFLFLLTRGAVAVCRRILCADESSSAVGQPMK